MTLVLFVIREHHAADPILPMDLMTRPTIAASLIGSCLVGGILFGIETYVPLYVQGVHGGNATLAGRMLMPLFLAWAISVAVAARAVVHRGFRFGALVGSALVAAGIAGAGRRHSHSRNGTRAVFHSRGWRLVGLGIGPTSFSLILAVQHSVNWGQRGVATGAVILLRTIGGALGVGLLARRSGWELAHRLAVAGRRDRRHGRAPARDPQAATATQLAVVQANLGLTLRRLSPDDGPGGRHNGLCPLAAKQACHARCTRQRRAGSP